MACGGSGDETISTTETALTIAARNLAKARELKAQENEERRVRMEVRKAELQAFFGRHPEVRAWAEDMKAHFGDGVRVRRFGINEKDAYVVLAKVLVMQLSMV